MPGWGEGLVVDKGASKQRCVEVMRREGALRSKVDGNREGRGEC